jgi:hypothetical protein
MGAMRFPLQGFISKTKTSAHRCVNFRLTVLPSEIDGLVKPLPGSRSFWDISQNPCSGMVGVRDRHQ